MMKRIFDIIFSFTGLLVLSPIFLVLWLLVKLDSPGPGFYRARRIGKDRRPYSMYKFRTMVVDADKFGPIITYRNDPRITRLGAYLREKRLDELPQLFNVLKGDMSMVGPRPESPQYVAQYTPSQLEILKVKPGITGPMQIAFLDEEEEIVFAETMDEAYMKTILPPKLKVELAYIQNQSLAYDIQLIWQTAWTLLFHQAPNKKGVVSWN